MHGWWGYLLEDVKMADVIVHHGWCGFEKHVATYMGLKYDYLLSSNV